MVAQALPSHIPEGSVVLAPRGAARDLLQRRDGEIIISGPVFTGKTYPALWKIHLAACKYPGMRGLFSRKENTSLAGSSLVTYRLNVLATHPDFARVTPFGGSKLEPPGYRYPNGSFIAVGGIDDSRILGSEYDLILVDEAREIAKGDWETLITRRRWGCMPYQQIIGATNPDGPSHWMWQRYAEGSLPMLFSRHQDNPRMHDGVAWTEFGSSYLADLDATMTGHRRARLLEGRWVGAEGVVYPEFNRETHVQTVDCAGWATALGLDVGTRNPTALLTVRSAGDRIHIERELYRRGMGSSAIVAAVETEYDATNPDVVVVDPSAAGIITDLRQRGIAARKATNDVIVGISRVTSALASLTVDPSCVNTIAEFESYRYPENRVDRDVPLKENDHALDALRYACMELVTGGDVVSW